MQSWCPPFQERRVGQPSFFRCLYFPRMGEPAPNNSPGGYEGFVGTKPPTAGTKRDSVKVATFNINNINKRLDNLLAWLSKAKPDVVSLQELKAEHEAFPVNALRTLGYEAV